MAIGNPTTISRITGAIQSFYDDDESYQVKYSQQQRIPGQFNVSFTSTAINQKE